MVPRKRTDPGSTSKKFEQRGNRAQAIAAVGDHDRIERRRPQSVQGLEALQRLLSLRVIGPLLEPRPLALERRLALVVGGDLAHHARGIGLIGRIEQRLAELAAAFEHRAAQFGQGRRAISVVGCQARDADRARIEGADRGLLGPVAEERRLLLWGVTFSSA